MEPLAPLTRYQRYVVFCAWVGLGFDLMDSILFNFISPIAIPDLLHLPPRRPRPGRRSASGPAPSPA